MHRGIQASVTCVLIALVLAGCHGERREITDFERQIDLFPDLVAQHEESLKRMSLGLNSYEHLLPAKESAKNADQIYRGDGDADAFKKKLEDLHALTEALPPIPSLDSSKVQQLSLAASIFKLVAAGTRKFHEDLDNSVPKSLMTDPKLFKVQGTALHDSCSDPNLGQAIDAYTALVLKDKRKVDLGAAKVATAALVEKVQALLDSVAPEPEWARAVEARIQIWNTCKELLDNRSDLQERILLQGAIDSQRTYLDYLRDNSLKRCTGLLREAISRLPDKRDKAWSTQDRVALNETLKALGTTLVAPHPRVGVPGAFGAELDGN